MNVATQVKYATTIGLMLFVSATNAAKPEPESYSGICDEIDYSTFTAAVQTAYSDTVIFGFGLPMWATLMDHTGKVCAVYSVGPGGDNGGDQAGNSAWLGSRVISAQKANTANAFSLDVLSIPTGAISATVYPGGSLYGLQHSNPVDTEVAYEGSAERYGTENDPMEGERVGGVNVFGGGIALYDGDGKVGSVGVSGDTSCRDAAMAYMLRQALFLDNTPNDDTLYLSVDAPSALFEQPACGVNDPMAADNVGVEIGSAD
jgi:uncharacterized protein GlcG (DUF336 family)